MSGSAGTRVAGDERVGQADDTTGAPVIASARTNRRTILVVDDESLIRWALHDRLGRAGYDVLEAESGWAAAAHLGVDGHGRDVDLVLLDYVVPGGGFQFVEYLRETFPRTHVIMMTSAVTADLVENARTREVRIVISKPFDANEVTRLVHGQLGS